MPDLYVASAALDGRFRPQTLIDDFKSLIWTERYNEAGDFQIEVKERYNFQNLRLLTYLRFSESNRLMVVDTVDTPRQVNGETLITVKGSSIESIFKARDTKMASARDGEALVGAPDYLIKFFAQKYAIDPATAGALNIIPNLQTNFYTEDLPSTTLWVDRGVMYDVMVGIAKSFNVGWAIRTSNDPSESPLYLYTYTGDDHTLDNLSYSEYSADNENLNDVSTFESIAGYRNHVRVLGAKTGVDVYAPNFNPTTIGLARRSMTSEFTDIGSKDGETDPAKITTVAADQAILTRKGQEILADEANRYQKLVDGVAQLKPGDALGDIVVLQDGNGVRSRMRITEIVHTVDSSGYQKIPTFASVD